MVTSDITFLLFPFVTGGVLGGGLRDSEDDEVGVVWELSSASEDSSSDELDSASSTTFDL